MIEVTPQTIIMRGQIVSNFVSSIYTVAVDYHPDLSSGSRADSAVSIDQSKDWIHLDKKDADKAIQDAQRALFDSKVPFSRASLVLRTHLGRHEPAAFLKVPLFNLEHVTFLRFVTVWTSFFGKAPLILHLKTSKAV